MRAKYIHLCRYKRLNVRSFKIQQKYLIGVCAIGAHHEKSCGLSMCLEDGFDVHIKHLYN